MQTGNVIFFLSERKLLQVTTTVELFRVLLIPGFCNRLQKREGIEGGGGKCNIAMPSSKVDGDGWKE